MAALSRAYRELGERLTETLARYDPIGLVDMAAPRSEYEPEGATILPRLREASSSDEVRRIVHEEFVRWFDADIAGPETAYRAVGEEIWALWLASPLRASTLS